MMQCSSVFVCVLVCVLGSVYAEPCYTCNYGGRGGGRGYATAGALASAGSFASGYGNGYGNSQASSIANSQASSYYGGNGYGQANSHANSQSQASSSFRQQPAYFGRPGRGGGCSWCGRRRRSVQAFIDSTDLIHMYNQIAADDKDTCGLRLVCELAQKDIQELAQDELNILSPYRGLGESDGTSYGNYDEAAWHGKEGRQCHTIYPQCPFTYELIMADYRNFQDGTLDQVEE